MRVSASGETTRGKDHGIDGGVGQLTNQTVLVATIIEEQLDGVLTRREHVHQDPEVSRRRRVVGKDAFFAACLKR